MDAVFDTVTYFLVFVVITQYTYSICIYVYTVYEIYLNNYVLLTEILHSATLSSAASSLLVQGLNIQQLKFTGGSESRN